jgi:hypothetical protein
MGASQGIDLVGQRLLQDKGTFCADAVLEFESSLEVPIGVPHEMNGADGATA